MIKSFRSKALAAFWSTGSSAKLDARMLARIERRLDALEAAASPEELKLPGFGFHALHGFDPMRYAIAVNGPWRITFAFDEGAIDVDLEQYH